MSQRTLTTRIKLLVKDLENWESIKSTFVPLDGEMCIVRVPGQNEENDTILFKVGNGTDVFENLPYSSALASDVYAWAKKSDLDWSDMSAAYKAALISYVSQELPGSNTLYQIVANGKDQWKLQKSEDGGTTWVDATGSIDVRNKVDHEITSDSGRALIFNENDGGGAKFEHSDGTYSYTGVNNGGTDGIAAQIYAINNNAEPVHGKKPGSRINVYKDKIFYISEANQTDGKVERGLNDDMEIMVKKDLEHKIDDTDVLILDCNLPIE